MIELNYKEAELLRNNKTNEAIYTLLKENNSLTQSELEEKLKMTKDSLTRRLYQLRKDGLLVKIDNGYSLPYSTIEETTLTPPKEIEYGIDIKLEDVDSSIDEVICPKGEVDNETLIERIRMMFSFAGKTKEERMAHFDEVNNYLRPLVSINDRYSIMDALFHTT